MTTHDFAIRLVFYPIFFMLLSITFLVGLSVITKVADFLMEKLGLDDY